MLPATTQSRTLHHQQHKHSIHQHPSQPNGGKSSGSTPFGSSKGTANLLQHSAGNNAAAFTGGGSTNLLLAAAVAEGTSQHDSGERGVQRTVGFHQHGAASTRPQSGKKRSTYLNASQGQHHTASSTVGSREHQASTHVKLPSNLKLTTTAPHLNSENANGGGPPLAGNYRQATTTTNTQHDMQISNANGLVSSPPKLKGQTRKPSGKSTKSNRAALAKKQLITHSSTIFPASSATNAHHLATTAATGGGETSVNAASSQQHQQVHHSQIMSPILSKINSKSHIQGTNNFAEAINNSIGGKTTNHASSTPGHKNMHMSQPRLLSAKGGSGSANTSKHDSLSHQLSHQASSYVLTKNQIDFRKNPALQHRNQTGKESYALSTNLFVTGEKPAAAEKRGLVSSNSVQVLGSVNNQGKTAKYKNLIEHGAVAAVKPAFVNQTNISATQKIPAQQSTNPVQGTNTNRLASQTLQSVSQSQSQQSQKFLPTITPAGQPTNQSSSTSPAGNQLQSQAMFAATGLSPYHSIEEAQQNIPNQPLGSSSSTANLQPLGGQTQSSDYFNLKQSNPSTAPAKYGNASGGGGSGPGQAIRSTSQPNLHGAQAMAGTSNPSQSLASGSSTFMPDVTNGAASRETSQPGNAQQSNPASKPTLHNLLSKNQGGSKLARSQSEPPQAQLKKSDSAASILENLRQRATFSVVMKAATLPKQPKRMGEKIGTEAQMASDSVKATVTKLLHKNQPQSTLPFFQTSKISAKAFGAVKAFAANTNVGTVRKANEDRISIILNVIQPSQKQPRIPSQNWPKLQIFGVYDGHGGSKCAEYLKDNLHNNIILQSEFPSDIHTAIQKGSYKTEEDFLAVAAPAPDQPHNKAGSCAIVIFVVDDDIFIVNVGDSRAIGSESQHPSDSMIQSKTAQVFNEYQSQPTVMPKEQAAVQMEAVSNVRQLSDDHKPSCPREFKRINDAGGYVYQTQTVMNNGLPTTQTQQVRQEECPESEDSDDEENPFVGPYRVFPGRLSVCRTFGDCEAKLTHLGGVRGVVTCEPEVTHEVLGANSLDYVLIGSDGIFDKLKNDAINQMVWDVTTKQRQLAFSQGKTPSIHTISGLVADEVLHASAEARSLDNLSVVFVAFERFKDYVESMQDQEFFAKPQLQILAQIEADLKDRTRGKFEESKWTSTNALTASSDRSGIQKSLKVNQFPASEAKTLHKSQSSVYRLDGQPHNSANNYMATNFNASSTPQGLKTANQGTFETSGYQMEANGPQEGGNSGKSASSSNQIYLNKIRDQQQQHQQSNKSAARHSGLLENINRPTSRQGTGRKGMRSRKANTGQGLTPSASGSHSQDSRPSLPEVLQLGKPASQSKHAYNQLSEVKGSVNSSSASTLPKKPLPQTSLQGQHSSQAPQHSSGQNQIYTSSREQQISSGNQQRRAALFKVNTATSGQSSQQQQHGSISTTTTSKGGTNLPDFFKVSSNVKTMTNSILGGNSPSLGSGANSSKYGKMTPSSAEYKQGVNGTGSSRQGGQRPKMKPYKSSQTRRMPDNSASVPMRFVTEGGIAAGPGGAKARNASQGAFSNESSGNIKSHIGSSNQATSNHRF